jgi:GWxTD domain-containing protein
VNEHWADGPVQWIWTAEEKRTWSELGSGAERQEFVDRFWESRNARPGNPDNMFQTSFERRVAFADAKFAVAEGTRGSLTDRGRVFVLLGPPTYASRKAIGAGEDASEEQGMSTEGSQDVTNALKAARGEGKLSAQRAATAMSSSSGTRATDSGASWREVWHYRRELLPPEVRYSQVDIEFVTKSGQGVGVLQRAPKTLLTLEAARAARR